MRDYITEKGRIRPPQGSPNSEVRLPHAIFFFFLPFLLLAKEGFGREGFELEGIKKFDNYVWLIRGQCRDTCLPAQTEVFVKLFYNRKSS